MKRVIAVNIINYNQSLFTNSLLPKYNFKKFPRKLGKRQQARNMTICVNLCVLWLLKLPLLLLSPKLPGFIVFSVAVFIVMVV